MNSEKYIYVLCYAYGSIVEIKLTDEDDKLTCEEILTKHGYNEDECSWMFVDGRRLKLESIE